MLALALLLASAQTADEEATLRERAALCGSEVAWAADWPAAAARARAERKLILIAFQNYPDFELGDLPSLGPFMEPDIVALTNARFVPLRFRLGMEAPLTDHAVYGTGPATFGVALLLAKPDGEVLRETFSLNTAVVIEFLRGGLRGHRGLAGAPPPPQTPTGSAAERLLARAAWLLACGEWEEAESLLEECARTDGADPLALALARAELLRLRRDPRGALAALAIAGLAAENSDRAREQTAALHAALGDYDSASAQLALVTSTPRTRFLGAMLLLAQGEHESGTTALRALALEDEPTRWSWWAAALATNAAFLAQERIHLALPTAAQIAEGQPLTSAPLPPRDAGRAQREAIAWLLATQRANGSWIHPSEIGAQPDDDPHALTLGATALAGIALVREARALDAHADGNSAREASSARAAAGRALDFLSAHAATLRARSVHAPELLMDYTVWSHSYAIVLAAECLADGIGNAAAARALAQDAVAALTAKQKSGGGWSYYLSGTVAGSAQPMEVSMSFTTAAVIRGLLRAPAAGAPVDAQTMTRALDALEAMRLEDGAFLYMVEHTSGHRVGGTPGDAAGRGPACALALYAASRTKQAELRARLALFVEHLPTLAREQGKALMHCGPEAQGAHYLLFDYWNAAAAVAALPRAQRDEFVAPLLEAILAARNDDGSFVDQPLIGRAAGTAMAVLALQALDAR
jgi:hypothetical protein